MSETEWKTEGQESKTTQVEIPNILPLLPLRDIVIYPYMMLPLFVGRDVSIRAVEESLSRDRLIFLVSQKNSAEENPNPADIHRAGTIASLMRTAKEKIEQILNLKNLPPEIVMVTDNIGDPGVLADLVASNLRLKNEESQAILGMFDPSERLKKVNELLSRELELSTMQARIQNQAKEEMTKTQRDYFLREQMKQIQQELGEGDDRAEEIRELRKQIDKAKMPPEAKREADKQLRRLEQMHPEPSEASLVRPYMDWLAHPPRRQ